MLFVEVAVRRSAWAPKTLADRVALGLVAERGRGAVHVDRVHFLRAEARLRERALHGEARAQPLGVRRRDVVRIRRGSHAEHLGVDARAARERVLERLEDQRSGAVAQHEAVARRRRRDATRWPASRCASRAPSSR